MIRTRPATRPRPITLAQTLAQDNGFAIDPNSMSSNMLLTTRTFAPVRRPNLVARPRLVNRLNEGLHQGHRLILVAAPAGFGKTTLIGEWTNSLDVPAAWLTLDEDCDDPGSFLLNMVAALQQVDEAFGQTIQPLLATLDAISEQNIVAALINDLADSPTGWLMVLDDYHAITDFAVHDLIGLLLEQQPPGCHIVIGTREDPPLPLARLRARGQMTEVRERSLRFRRDEAAAFLNETMKLTLSAASITALEDRTEGWAAGLQLAALALLEEAGSGRAETFITTFSGDDRYIMDYLMTEVLQRQPADIRIFLHQTAILDRITAPLCDAVLDSGDEATGSEGNRLQFPLGRSQEILEYLDRVNLFIIPLDHRREWYRYHRLFAEFLRASLDPSQQQPIHRRAAAWYEQNGFPQEAVKHKQATSMTIRSSQTALAQSLIEPLSEREVEVLVLIAAGLKNREIGRELYITTGTVKRHTNHIYGKLGVHNRTAAVARARELGLI